VGGEKAAMIGLSKRERQALVQEMARRYERAGKRERGLMLDELCTLAGCDRGYAARLLRAEVGAPPQRLSRGPHHGPDAPNSLAESPARLGGVSTKDVARASGVSTGTVSNVLNHPERVAEATRLRVEETVRRLGFVRNESARHLRAGRSHTLGLLLLDAWNPFFTEIARGVEDWTFARGWAVVISNSARQVKRESTYLDLFVERRVAGIIVVPIGDLATRLTEIRHRGIPSVMLDQMDSGEGSMSVSLDDVRGGELAMAHLLDLGHRHVAFAGNPGRVTQVRDRLLGATNAIAAASPPVHLSMLEPEDLTIGSGRTIGEHLVRLSESERPTALFATSDMLAIGILQVLLQQGVRVPEDIAIVGYDDIDFARQVAVPLTSIVQPAYEMGRIAAELLTTQLTGTPPETPHVVFEPRLVVRESTVGARGRGGLSADRPAAGTEPECYRQTALGDREERRDSRVSTEPEVVLHSQRPEAGGST
jgi:LacI family transcriptional regulator